MRRVTVIVVTTRVGHICDHIDPCQALHYRAIIRLGNDPQWVIPASVRPLTHRRCGRFSTVTFLHCQETLSPSRFADTASEQYLGNHGMYRVSDLETRRIQTTTHRSYLRTLDTNARIDEQGTAVYYQHSIPNRIGLGQAST